MSDLIAKIKKNNSTKNIFLFFNLFISLEIIFLVILIPRFSFLTAGEQILDMKFSYNYREVYSTIESFGQQGIEFYRYIQLLDLVFPIVYAVTFSLLLSRFKITNKIKMIILLPSIAALFDYLENLGIFMMLKIHPGDYYLIAKVTNILTISKFIVLVLFISIIPILVVIKMKNNFRSE